MNTIIKNRLIGIIRQAVFLFNYLSMPFESSCFPLPLKSASSISCFLLLSGGIRRRSRVFISVFYSRTCF